MLHEGLRNSSECEGRPNATICFHRVRERDALIPKLAVRVIEEEWSLCSKILIDGQR
jgi:hypothetical protein